MSEHVTTLSGAGADSDDIVAEWDAFNFLETRWSLRVLIVLAAGPRRFADLQRSVPGLSGRMLSERLRQLERAGFVSRTIDAGPPITSTYELSPRGLTLVPTLSSLRDCVASWSSEDSQSRAS